MWRRVTQSSLILLACCIILVFLSGWVWRWYVGVEGLQLRPSWSKKAKDEKKAEDDEPLKNRWADEEKKDKEKEKEKDSDKDDGKDKEKSKDKDKEDSPDPAVMSAEEMAVARFSGLSVPPLEPSPGSFTSFMDDRKSKKLDQAEHDQIVEKYKQHQKEWKDRYRRHLSRRLKLETSLYHNRKWQQFYENCEDCNQSKTGARCHACLVDKWNSVPK